MANTVQLTESLRVVNAAHILYCYDELEDYLTNAVSYIRIGLELGQHIIVIENRLRFEAIILRLKPTLSEEELARLNYVDNFEFYRLSEAFEFNLVLQNFLNAAQPYLNEAIPVRVWGHVVWNDQEYILDNLSTYECHCDLTVHQLGILTVCCYSAQTLSATILIRMMKCHEYIMIDKEITRSNLYNRRDETVVFPSLTEHEKIQDEVDFYKQKLDFVHVVSHEVRNPLTVIKAYASMMLKEEMSQGAKNKLAVIQDYVTVIDNEISHIINTEQMLTSEALWRKSAISPMPVIKDVIDIMETKARTQGIKLQTSVSLTGREVMKSNSIGLRLIISNLLSNAIKYSYEGSIVLLDVCVKEKALLFQIKDSGLGMRREQQPKLFQKYQKMNTEQDGQGIGLFMVKKLVDHFEGEIRIESEIGRGTEVFVKLTLISE